MITIITLYDDKLADYFVGAVEGTIDAEQRAEIAANFDAIVDGIDGSHEEDARTIGFREVELVKADERLLLKNIWASND